MKKIEIHSIIEVVEHPADLSSADRELIEKAWLALENAYAPYSGFQVGSAALLENGEIIIGNNQENAAYPLSLCAERVAVFQAKALFPKVPIQTVAVTSKNQSRVLMKPAAPCGSCRQVFLEMEYRQKSPIRILLRGEKGPIYIINTVQDILPLSFDASFL